MQNKALVVIDIQNDITKHYKEIIDNLNAAIAWAVAHDILVVYIKHNNPDTPGAELVPEMNIASDHIFTKTKGNALTSEAFASFIKEEEIGEFFIAGADATACVKSTCFNMTKAGYVVHVLSDCITSYDKTKIDGMLQYYASKGCLVEKLNDAMGAAVPNA